MVTRRRFIQQSAILSLSPLMPMVLARGAIGADVERDERILVVIQMSGGNDGLNTVIPYADEEYGKVRRTLCIDRKEIVKISDHVGLHPAMEAAGALFDDGRLAIVQGVCYPNPSRSHFRSMATWHTARLDSDEHTGHGWLGRALDGSPAEPSRGPDSVFVGDGNVPTAILGRRSKPVSLNSQEELLLSTGFAQAAYMQAGNELESFLQETVNSSLQAARQLAEGAKADARDLSTYPESRLGQKLKLMAKLIRMRTGTRVFYVSQPGYDTHSAQALTHQRLLREFSTSLKAFLDDMEAAGFGDQVNVLAFSEFGRRVKENGSAGTDHGTAGPVFVAGKNVNAGLLGETPSLTDLDEEGDLKWSVDFRQVYSSLLQDWIGIDPVSPIGEDVNPLSVVGSFGPRSR